MTPEGWRTARLQDLAENPSGDFVDGDWIESKDQDENGTIRLLQVGNVLRGKLKTEGSTRWVNEDTARRLKCTLLREGDILIARMPDPIGRACLLPSLPYLSITAVDCAVLRVDRARVSPSFAVQYFNSDEHLAGVASHITGTTRQRISRSNLARLPIPLPPVGEQCKIAAILSSMDEAIEATQAVIDQFQVVKKAMMAELLTRGLPGRHTRLKQTEIGEVPEGWDVVPLGRIASVDRGKFSHRPRNDPRFYGGPYPFVQTGDVAASEGRLTRFSQTLNDEGLKVSRMFPAGTIIITIAANIGDTGIAMFPVAFPDSLVGILAGARIDNRFLELVLRTRKKTLEDSAPQNAQKNINLETLRPLQIQVPPMSEQLQIASVFDAMDGRVKAEAEAGQYLRLAKSALMSVLLTGEVRVTPDKAAA